MTRFWKPIGLFGIALIILSGVIRYQDLTEKGGFPYQGQLARNDSADVSDNTFEIIDVTNRSHIYVVDGASDDCTFKVSIGHAELVPSVEL